MKRVILTIQLIILALFCANAQDLTAIDKKAEKSFEKLDYFKTIETYQKADTLSLDAKRTLAASYRLSNQTEEAEVAYKSLVSSTASSPEDIYYYAYSLRENKKYDEANFWMTKFEEIASAELIIQNFESEKDNLQDLLLDKGQFSVKNLEINSSAQDFGPSYFGDKVVFASSRENIKIIKRRWNGNYLPFLDLYVATNENNELSNPELLKNAPNKKFHEGPASFAKEYSLMAYTSNNYTGKSIDGIIKLKLFFSQLEEETWSQPTAFYLNNDQYSVGQPYLTEDGKTLFFASDMPGGFGGVDIYKVVRTEGEEWSQPINLGKDINTEGNEMFPYLQEDSKVFFFASDGKFGLGGLDIFAAPMKEGQFSTIKNLGTPINSERDDFALIVDKEMKSGYFSSNRPQGKGDDDIYSFNLLKPLIFGKRLIGVSKDKNGQILSGTSMYLFDGSGEFLDSTLSNENGQYEFLVEADKDFLLNGSKEKYFDGQTLASSKTPEEVIIADVELLKDPGLSLYVLITDKSTKQMIPDVKMTLTDKKTSESEVLELGSLSEHRKALSENKINDKIDYTFKLEAPGYLSKTVSYQQLLDREGQYDVHKTLDLTLDKIIEGETKLEDLIEINPIYFDLNKSLIRPDAAKELDKIVQVMNENPTMVVELGSHTDCRASIAYNESLSDRRAKASAKYISERISDPKRIYGKGYGESQLLNGCACEGSTKSTCSEEEHQLNRRTEFKIIKFDSPNTKVINTSPDSFEK